MKLDETKLFKIRKHIENFFNLDDIFKKTRKREYVEARSLFFTYAFRILGYRKYHIAKSVGADHATVIHSINNYYIYQKYNKKLAECYKSLNYLNKTSIVKDVDLAAETIIYY